MHSLDTASPAPYAQKKLYYFMSLTRFFMLETATFAGGMMTLPIAATAQSDTALPSDEAIAAALVLDPQRHGFLIAECLRDDIDQWEDQPSAQSAMFTQQDGWHAPNSAPLPCARHYGLSGAQQPGEQDCCICVWPKLETRTAFRAACSSATAKRSNRQAQHLHEGRPGFARPVLPYC